MILKFICPSDIVLFSFKGFSTVYRLIKHLPDNNSIVESVNSGCRMTVKSDKLVECQNLETL